MHINYFFAKDLIDNVVWNVVGAPATENQKLHATNGNYIWRAFTLGAYDMQCDFDLFCTDPNKVAFMFFDNVTAPSSGATTYRHWVRLMPDSNGQLCCKYQYQKFGMYQTDSVVTGANLELGYTSSAGTHIKITYFDTGEWRVEFGGGLASFNYTMATRSWRVYLGNTADCTIDNFKLIYNGDKISELDFD